MAIFFKFGHYYTPYTHILLPFLVVNFLCSSVLLDNVHKDSNKF